MSNYTSENIKVLKELEPIRERPGMFIGSTKDVTHLIKEAIDNAMDELINNYASKVGIFLNTIDKVYTIVDNGRGIPLGQVDGQPAPIIIATKLFSGGKFDKDAYQVSAGLHGVGLVAINALSEWMEIDIFRKENGKMLRGYFKFVDGLVSEQEIKEYNQQVPYSTRITFKPSKKYFESLTLDTSLIQQRLIIGSLFTNKEIVYSVNDNKVIIKEDIFSYFNNKLVKNALFDPIFVEFQNKNEKISLIFTYEQENEPNKIYASVNLLPVNSGTHITLLQNLFINMFEKYKKNHSFKRNDSLIGLKCYFNIFIEDTAYTSQTKEALSTSKTKLSSIMNEKFIEKIEKELKNKKLIDKLLEKFDYYRDHLKSKNLKHVLNNKKQVRGITNMDSKLRDCQLYEGSELYIIEGDSAGGTCIKARNPKIHAILPLKGKITNIANKNDLDKILQNKEVQDIIRSIGVIKTKSKKDNVDDLRYEKIIVAADADPDGKHIATLLLILFSILSPNIIKQGRLFIAEMPLYGLQTKNEFYPAWTLDELDELDKKYNGHKLRFKGLGEYEPHQLYKCLFDKRHRKLYQVNWVDDEFQEYILKLVTLPAEKRKLFIENENI